MIKCPECNSSDISTDRRPDGNSICISCGYNARASCFIGDTIVDNSKNNGGETDYYKIEPEWNTHQDVIEAREMNYAQGNIYKVACTFNTGRHKATNYERELNKIIWFAKRELERIKSE